jgi:hypothetical protein
MYIADGKAQTTVQGQRVASELVIGGRDLVGLLALNGVVRINSVVRLQSGEVVQDVNPYHIVELGNIPLDTLIVVGEEKQITFLELFTGICKMCDMIWDGNFNNVSEPDPEPDPEPEE